MNKIAELNDRFRTTGHGGIITMTSGVADLPRQTQTAIVQNIMGYNEWEPDNDPYQEHDFGSVQVRGWLYFFKIDYYNADMSQGSEDPSDPSQTTRVMTIMAAVEY